MYKTSGYTVKRRFEAIQRFLHNDSTNIFQNIQILVN